MPKPARVSEVLEILTEAPELTQDVRDAIWGALLRPGPDDPYTPHRSCPCIRCHEFYGTLDR